MAPVLAEQLLAPQTFCTSSASVARSEISQCFFFILVVKFWSPAAPVTHTQVNTLP